MRRQDFEFLLDLLKANAGWEFDETQYFIVDKKLTTFIREKDFASVEDLVMELKTGNRPLISQVVEALAFSDTLFFRDFDVFHRFQKVLLPSLKQKCRANKKLNIWSLGCSTGQEPYSIAMAINKADNMFADWDINILGSDLSSLAINKAQKGCYNNFEIQTGLNAQTILEYFNFDNEQWKIRDDIRNMVEFRRYNMLEEVIVKSKFEVVFCRNVLRYFAPEHQDELNEIFNTDEGARYIGEFSLGFNPMITKPMGDILYDEKIMGSLHFTPGRCYEDCDNSNISSIHWDLVLIQTEEYGGGEIYFDDVLIRKDGKFVLEELKDLN